MARRDPQAPSSSPAGFGLADVRPNLTRIDKAYKGATDPVLCTERFLHDALAESFLYFSHLRVFQLSASSVTFTAATQYAACVKSISAVCRPLQVLMVIVVLFSVPVIDDVLWGWGRSREGFHDKSMRKSMYHFSPLYCDQRKAEIAGSVRFWLDQPPRLVSACHIDGPSHASKVRHFVAREVGARFPFFHAATLPNSSPLTNG